LHVKTDECQLWDRLIDAMVDTATSPGVLRASYWRARAERPRVRRVKRALDRADALHDIGGES